MLAQIQTVLQQAETEMLDGLDEADMTRLTAMLEHIDERVRAVRQPEGQA